MLTINNQFSAARNHFGGDLEPPTAASKKFNTIQNSFLGYKLLKSLKWEKSWIKSSKSPLFWFEKQLETKFKTHLNQFKNFAR